MCLIVDKKIRNNHHRENGYCVAYKVIYHNNNSTIFARCGDFLYTIGENTPYKLNEHGMPSLFQRQRFDNEKVYFGLHLFLDKRIAKKLVLHNNIGDSKDIKMIKVYYKPEDVIAYGFSNTFEDEGEKSVVVRKLTIKSLDPIE